jgi:hypothetical protein
MKEQKNSPNGEEQYIIEKLKAQKNSVRPSSELLSKIIAQLPEQESVNAHTKKQYSFSWLRFAIPVGAVALLGGIFFASQFSPAPAVPPVAIIETAGETPEPIAMQAINPVPPEQSLSLAAIAQEEQQIDQQLTFESFFADEQQMQEIDAALAGF